MSLAPTRSNCSTLLALTAMSLVATACGEGEGTAASHAGTVRDSAGVVIVEHAAVPADLPVWTIQDPADVRIGSLDGSGPEVFGRIAGISLQSDGSVVVAEAQALELRAFSADGAHLWSAGRGGAGPGEFSGSITRLSRMVGDSLLVSDGNDRTMVFGPDGSYARQLRIPEPPETFGRFRIIGVLADGMPVGVSSILMTGEGIPSGVTRGREMVGTLDTSGAMGQRLGEFRSRESTIAVRMDAAGAISSMEVRRLTMGRSSMFAVGATAVVAGETDRFDLVRYDLSGGPTTIIRVALPQRLTDDDMRQRTLAMDSNLVVSDTLPAYTTIRLDDADRIWVQEFVPVHEERAPQWWVLDANGAFVARVDAPRGFDPLAFTGEQVWGVRLDAFDVPYVERHRIVR